MFDLIRWQTLKRNEVKIENIETFINVKSFENPAAQRLYLLTQAYYQCFHIGGNLLESGESRGVSPVWCWGGGAPWLGSGGPCSWCRRDRWRGCAGGHWICPSQTSLSAELPRSPGPACRTSELRESRQRQRLHCRPHNIFPGQPTTTEILKYPGTPKLRSIIQQRKWTRWLVLQIL